MVLQSSSYSATLQAQVKFDVRSAPFPVPDGGTRRAAAGGATIVSFAADPAKLADQWTVIKELISPRGITNLVTASGFAPVSKAAADDPQYLGGYLQRNPLAKAGWDQMTDLVPWYQFPGSHNVEIGQDMSDEINKAVAGEQSPQAALDSAAAGTRELVK
jgi:multiple sugar transport system substrate-binding protein